MSVKFVDIPAQYSDIESDIIKAIADLIHTSSFVGGPAVANFEIKLAQYVGARFVVGCSDGTNALLLSLLAAGIKGGDAVIIPANTFIATANAVVHAGGIPMFVDCDSDSYLVDLNQVEDVLKAGKAKFLIPVHLYGNPCPMKRVMEIANKYGGAGALNASSISLKPTDAAKYSNLTDGRITGNLTGSLIVRESSGGEGGTVDFTIDGAADGDLVIPTVSTLTIDGDATGTIDVEEVAEDGYLWISGSATGDVYVSDIGINGTVDILDDATGDYVVVDNIAAGGEFNIGGTASASTTVGDIAYGGYFTADSVGSLTLTGAGLGTIQIDELSGPAVPRIKPPS